MYYYQHHIGDFKRDTEMLTDHQSMAYLRLLWIYYDTEKPLPDDPERLAFLVRSDEKTVSLILDHFFYFDSGQWRHTRCDDEISRFQERSAKASQAAKSRWGNADAMQAQCERNANASVEHANASISDANQEPTTSNQEPIDTNGREKGAKRFTPPTKEQVEEYCKERGCSIDPQRFVDFYAAKGWMIGKNRMKDWKAAVRTWESKQPKQEAPRKRKML
jgi:uncharacterized protein YdaU (DUF1376 family)